MPVPSTQITWLVPGTKCSWTLVLRLVWRQGSWLSSGTKSWSLQSLYYKNEVARSLLEAQIKCGITDGILIACTIHPKGRTLTWPVILSSWHPLTETDADGVWHSKPGAVTSKGGTEPNVYREAEHMSYRVCCILLVTFIPLINSKWRKGTSSLLKHHKDSPVAVFFSSGPRMTHKVFCISRDVSGLQPAWFHVSQTFLTGAFWRPSVTPTTAIPQLPFLGTSLLKVCRVAKLSSPL